MDSEKIRKMMVSLWDYADADGAQVGAKDGFYTITLLFDRERKVEDGPDSGVHGPVGRGPAVVAEEVAAKPTGGTEVAPARRMWKRWGHIGNDVGFYHVVDSGVAFTILPAPDDTYREPVTILPGHDAVEQIEREAWNRGHAEGVREAKAIINSNEVTRLAELRGDRFGYERGKRDALAIDGVEPVVVDGFTFDNGPPWTHMLNCDGRVVAVFEDPLGDCKTPCRVHLYQGVGSDGKKVQP